MTPLAIAILSGCLVVAGGTGGLVAMGAMGHGPMASWMSGHGNAMGTNACPMCAENWRAAGTTGTGTLVVMRSYQFQPTTLDVHVGQTVTWRNDDAVAHTVTSDAGTALDSPLIAPGATWTHAFTTTGTFDYHCTPHSARDANGGYAGMTGTIVVS